MNEQTPELSEHQDIAHNEVPSPITTLYHPRSAWLEFILTFFTLTLSSPFWLVARVKEIKSLSNKNLTPWLWFFVFLYPLFQVFALPKLFSNIDDLCDDNDAPNLGLWKSFIFIAIVAATITFNIMDKIELPFWSFYIALLLYATAIAVFQNRLNILKKNLNGVSFKPIKYKYKIWEWMLLIVGAPFSLFLCYYTLIQPLTVKSTPLLKGSILAAPDTPYQITIKENGWSKAEIGTHSDGSGELELTGPFLEMHLIVFSHGFDSSLNSVSYWRQGQVIDSSPSAKCTHTRTFEGDTLQANAFFICESKSMGDPEITLSKTIHTSKGIYEVYGYFSSSKMTFNNHKNAFIAAAKGFIPK